MIYRLISLYIYISSEMFFFALFPAAGMNQLLWYYADLERNRCDSLKAARVNESLKGGEDFNLFKFEREPEGCILWRRFSK